MDPVDHRWTSSYGGGMEAIEYRAEVQDLIQQGKMRDAMAREIWDVRRAAAEGSGSATKYNEAVREMLDYAKGQGYLNK
jgi:filamentous hemagglutinin